MKIELDELLTVLLLAVLLPFPLGLICIVIDIKTAYFTRLFRRVFGKFNK